MEGSFAERCLLMVPHTGMNTTIQSQEGSTTQKRPTQPPREDQCVVRSEEG